MAEEIQEAVQIIRVVYEGVEIAIKIGGGGLSIAQDILESLVGLLEHEKLHGKTNVKKLLQKGGDLQVFQFNDKDLKKVEKLLKKYGVLYSVLPDRNKKDGKKEVLFHSEAVPRVNMIAQKLVYGRIGTYDEYVKGGEPGNAPSHTEKKEKVSMDLLEKVGALATEKKKTSVEKVQKAFKISKEEAEKILEQLVAMGVLKKSKKAGTYDALMGKEAFEKKMKEYKELVKRAEEVEQAKNPELIDITISEVMVADERKDAVKTRVPGTWGENVRYLWTAKADMAVINDGKTFLTTLDPDREYKLYDANDKVVQTISGRDLYAQHYDPVAIAVRERYEKRQQEEQRERRRQDAKQQGKRQHGQGAKQRGGQGAGQHGNQPRQGQRQGSQGQGQGTKAQGTKNGRRQGGQQGRRRPSTPQSPRRR